MENINLQLVGKDIVIDCMDFRYLNAVSKHFTYYVPNYRFMPRYQSGSWNGQSSMFKKGSRKLPYGLLSDLVRYSLGEWSEEYNLVLDDEIKNLFNPPERDVHYDLIYYPYWYQEEVIEIALRFGRGIFRCPTASGKSLMITYIVKTLLPFLRQQLIIVPNLGLIKQFHDDMIEYGISENLIGKVNKDFKQFDKPIVVSTWQTLKNNEKELERYDNVIVDEVHGAKGSVLYDLMKKTTSQYTFGFTGTIPDHPLDEQKVKAYIGPILKEYTNQEIADGGYIAKGNVNVIDIHYKQDFSKDYNTMVEETFNHPFRLNLIKSIINKVTGSILLLVGKVEKEGDVLKGMLEAHLEGKTIEFLSGRDNAEIRAEWQKKVHNRKDIVLIATYGIFQAGINIKSLKHLILVSSFKSNIRVLQSVGRTLRMYENKEKTGAFVWDLVDQTKIIRRHGNLRMNFYEREGFNINQMIVTEGKTITL